MPSPGPIPVRRGSFILFGLVSLLTFAGPVLIMWVGRGGTRPHWPPDRPIEWQVFIGVIATYLLLMTLLLADSIRHLRALKSHPHRPANPDQPDQT